MVPETIQYGRKLLIFQKTVLLPSPNYTEDGENMFLQNNGNMFQNDIQPKEKNYGRYLTNWMDSVLSYSEHMTISDTEIDYHDNTGFRRYYTKSQ
jgi:hypothetical protein